MDVRKYLPDGFVVGILVMILLAWAVPGIGGESSAVSLSRVVHYGIMGLFFLYGLKLDLSKLRDDLSNWRVHLWVQVVTFLVFPLLVLPFYPFFRHTSYETMWLAVFFLAAIPSTVSSSVVMVSIARGNIASAIFNASASGLLGIVITPLWMGIFLGQSRESFALGEVLLDLVSQILLPVIVGLLLNPYLGRIVKNNLRYVSFYDKAVILANVYQCFSDSFRSGVFAGIEISSLVTLGVLSILLFFAVFAGTGYFLKRSRFSREDRITILFCGSKKSLIHGVVFAGVLFAGTPSSGLFLVPMMIYHAFQLFYVSIVARKFSEEIS